MKIRLFTIVLLLSALLSATALFADGPVRRTIVVKDVKCDSSTEDGHHFPLDTDLLDPTRAYLGVSLLDLTDELRAHYGAQNDSGLLVASVEAGSQGDMVRTRVRDISVSV